MCKTLLERLIQVEEEVENSDRPFHQEQVEAWLTFLNTEPEPPKPQWQHIGNPSLAKQGEGVWTLWEENIHTSGRTLFDGGLLGMFNILPTPQKIKSLTNQGDSKVEEILNGDIVRG